MKAPAKSASHEGWSNYETWCVALWINNDESSYSYWKDVAKEMCPAMPLLPRTRATLAVELAARLKSELSDDAPDLGGTVWSDLLSAAIGEVDWFEIATTMLWELMAYAAQGEGGMNRADAVLAVLSTSDGAEWTPVQVQKIFFLLDSKVPGAVGGPHWDFKPYDYGPFDAEVYTEIERLSSEGLTHIDQPAGGIRTFRLTPEGQRRGQAALALVPAHVRAYVSQLSTWLRSLSFQQLVSVVYKEFPAMRANSVFRD